LKRSHGDEKELASVLEDVKSKTDGKKSELRGCVTGEEKNKFAKGGIGGDSL